MIEAVINIAKQSGREKQEGRHNFGIPKDSLSPRETEVCLFLAEGLPLKEIAFRLRVSIHTADFHARNVYRKLEVHSRAELFKHFAKDQVIEVRHATRDPALAHISERLDLIEAKLGDILAYLLTPTTQFNRHHLIKRPVVVRAS